MAQGTKPAQEPHFGPCVRFLIDRLEGGGARVTDSGGLTRWGISTRAYPNLDIENLSREGAEAIYARDYWAPVAADAMEPGLALLVFSAAVNAGARAAAIALQRVLGVAEDGKVGPGTLGAVATYRPRAELRAAYCEMQLREYEALVRRVPAYTKYHHGWRMRVMRAADEAGRLGLA